MHCARTIDTSNDTAETVPQITVVVCTARPALAFECIMRVSESIQAGDRMLAIVDCDGELALQAARTIRELGAEVIVNQETMGLSYSRNLAIRELADQYVLFIDDDVWLNASALKRIRQGLGAGATIVGVRLSPPKNIDLGRWFLSASQLHYLALHRPDRVGCTWGACMALDIGVIKRQNLTFREDLGRLGGGLQCGDDTTMIREVLRIGGTQMFIDDASVEHRVHPDRIRFRYLLRRSFWQGRSEVRRGNVSAGFFKELRRNGDTMSVRGILLMLIYMGSVTLGMAQEVIAQALKILTSKITHAQQGQPDSSTGQCPGNQRGLEASSD